MLSTLLNLFAFIETYFLIERLRRKEKKIIFMRKATFMVMSFFAMVTMLFSTTGCFDKKPPVNDSVPVLSKATDSAGTDTMAEIIAESPMSKTADELFDDFFFNFAANKKLQYKRIKFPLPVFTNSKQTSVINKAQWKMDYFFMKQGYFSLIFDNMKQMNVVKDTSVAHVTVEKIIFAHKTIKQYIFDRINGEFMLTSIAYKPIQESFNASFLKFYKRFSVDTVFQERSMSDMVEFTAPDPDDDFGTITGTIIPEQWPGFKPAIIPHGVVYNILYGQKYKSGTQKLFVVRGIATDLEIVMVFKKHRSSWKLVKFNT